MADEEAWLELCDVYVDQLQMEYAGEQFSFIHSMN
jgi:hypothetical protein